MWPFVAASAALGHLQAPFEGAAHVALRYMAPAYFEADQAPPWQPPLDGGALEHQETQDWVPLTALAREVHLQAPFEGAALEALAGTGHQPTQDWAALVTCMHYQARSQPGRER